MQIITEPTKMKIISRELRKDSVGFIPTMGALHGGHFGLIQKSLTENDITIVSIFVNPTQFNQESDYKNYPITINEDINKLTSLNVDYLFNPKYELIYKDDYAYKVKEEYLSTRLCGEFRKGHFDGVLTVVMKLLNIVSPTRAYFGEKDYQQFLLIKKMVQAFFMDIEIISLPTVREQDGLAISSRNLLLSSEEREQAPEFYSLLNSDNDDDEISFILTEKGFKVDYIQTIDRRRYGAVNLGNVRLIDNVEK